MTRPQSTQFIDLAFSRPRPCACSELESIRKSNKAELHDASLGESFALARDDGQSARNHEEADVILVGASPTCTYLANRGIKAAMRPSCRAAPCPVSCSQRRSRSTSGSPRIRPSSSRFGATACASWGGAAKHRLRGAGRVAGGDVVQGPKHQPHARYHWLASTRQPQGHGGCPIEPSLVFRNLKRITPGGTVHGLPVL